MESHMKWKGLSNLFLLKNQWESNYMEIVLTDEEARYLIRILKFVFKKYQVDLSPGNKGDILLITNAEENREFILHYFTSQHIEGKISLHLRDKESNISLVRLNIDPNGFHKNSNGETVRGNRILIFSSEEWINKNDGYTHMKAYNLPNDFKNVDSPEQVFIDFLLYINVKREDKITFVPFLQ